MHIPFISKYGISLPYPLAYVQFHAQQQVIDTEWQVLIVCVYSMNGMPEPCLFTCQSPSFTTTQELFWGRFLSSTSQAGEEL
jgi:hypothetical protein